MEAGQFASPRGAQTVNANDVVGRRNVGRRDVRSETQRFRRGLPARDAPTVKYYINVRARNVSRPAERRDALRRFSSADGRRTVLLPSGGKRKKSEGKLVVRTERERSARSFRGLSRIIQVEVRSRQVAERQRIVRVARQEVFEK